MSRWFVRDARPKMYVHVMCMCDRVARRPCLWAVGPLACVLRAGRHREEVLARHHGEGTCGHAEKVYQNRRVRGISVIGDDCAQVEKERMMVRENRQGDRRDGALEKDLPDSDGGEGVGAIGDHVSDSYAAREVDGGEGGGGLDGDGGLWWGARRWDEEAADDVWCVADSVVAALAQLLRAEVISMSVV